MLKNYFLIMWRGLVKNRAYSFINILGLAIHGGAADQGDRGEEDIGGLGVSSLEAIVEGFFAAGWAFVFYRFSVGGVYNERVAAALSLSGDDFGVGLCGDDGGGDGESGQEPPNGVRIGRGRRVILSDGSGKMEYRH